MVPKHRGIRSLSQKLIHYYQFDEWELFDLSKDPNEDHNLYKSEAYQRQIDELKTKLDELMKAYEDDSDISVMPEEWRRIYRGPDARKKLTSKPFCREKMQKTFKNHKKKVVTEKFLK